MGHIGHRQWESARDAQAVHVRENTSSTLISTPFSMQLRERERERESRPNARTHLVGRLLSVSVDCGFTGAVPVFLRLAGFEAALVGFKALALRFGGMPSAVRPHGTGHRLKIRECWARRGVPIAPDDKTICGFHVGIAPQSSGDTELFLSGKSECQGKRGGVSGLQG
eukprot:9474016-Pyramimonas_sp.AAC.1